MDTILILVVVLAIGLVVLAGAWYFGMMRRRRTMQSQFGSEYDQTVATAGSKREADTELMRRRERVEKLALKELPAERRVQLQADWVSVQSRFVDDPRGAVRSADSLIGQAMWERGYPAQSFDEMAADASVDHPEAVVKYRDAHTIAAKDQRSGATTEELRRAFQNFRNLFDEVVGDVPATADLPARQGAGAVAPTAPGDVEPDREPENVQH